jgi:lipopolysaccharide biosynthesis glycosyltransferase
VRQEKTVHVAMCIDCSFAVPLAACLASVDAFCFDRETIVHVVHSGFDEELRMKVSRGLDNISINWIEANDQTLSGAHYSVFLSRASLYRLLLGDLLPDDIERVVYLDADTVVGQSLGPLADFALDDRMIVGAVSDAQAPWAAGPLGPPWQLLGLNPSSKYFNSGVLLIDLARWRQERVGRECIDLLRKVTPRWGDQDALNTILEGRWQELPRRYNVQSADTRRDSIAWALWKDEVQEAVANPAIVHYTEGAKPWLKGSQHAEADRWFHWLDQTTWTGWRPTEERPAAWKTGARHAFRFLRSRLETHPSRLPA